MPRTRAERTRTIEFGLLNRQRELPGQLDRLEANSCRAVAIANAAPIAAMRSRNFLRRFKLEMLWTTSEYMLRIQLELNCRQLPKQD
jgi:transcriptional regulator GlxA family with amidase domain